MKNKIWFTADYHFSHENIIKYCNRPFKNADDMNKCLISNHNSIIGNDDDVYILGDYSIKTKNYRGTYEWITKKLRGRLHLIMGNHDVKDPWFYTELGFCSIHVPYFKVEEFICVHDPSLSITDSKSKFLCGHIHNLFIFNKNCLNVGIDVHNYYPISINRVREIFNLHYIK